MGTGDAAPMVARPGSMARKLSVDAAAALSAALTFAPLAVLVDTAIIQAANGTSPNMFAGMYQSAVAAVKNPLRFLTDRKFLAVYAVYSATYSVANASGTIATSAGQNPTAPRFIATTITNLSASIKKDSLLSRWTSGKAPLPTPVGSLACWGSRDAMTVFTSFVLVEPTTRAVMKVLPEDFVERYPNGARNTMQFVLPVAVQWLSAPIHLLGLDLYNHQLRFGAVRSPNDRWALIKREYIPAAIARSMRIAAAFGIGGVANRMFHESYSDRFLGKPVITPTLLFPEDPRPNEREK